MIKTFISERWQVTKVSLSKHSSLAPFESSVYLITLIIKGKRKLIYIGSTKCLRRRLSAHRVLKSLIINRTDYDIEILHKDFGGLSVNRLTEQRLIQRHKPIFNKIASIREFNNDLWKELGITKLKLVKKKNKFQNFHDTRLLDTSTLK